MKHYGLIGYPLSHSFSATYFNNKFELLGIDADYKPIELLQIGQIKTVIKRLALNGFNVTIPYKEKIIPYLDIVDPIAKDIGAVNCVCVKNNVLHGYNTDYIGFEQSLQQFLPTKQIKALIFGNGGASKAIRYALQKLGIAYQLVTRKPSQDSITYEQLNRDLLHEYTLLINTTPVGTYPAIDEYLPIPYAWISSKHYAFDLIYNPTKTKFLAQCEQHGAKIQNGYAMLCLQADAAYTIFSDFSK